MEVPSKTTDEDIRLDTLRALQLLDTGPEERFDRLTRVTARLLDMPWSLITLVDAERLWIKSARGLEMQEIPRRLSFCGHAIHDDDIMVVPDALADARFADNPMVVGDPGFRFYAGCPLASANGSKVGTLCVYDTRPRELTDEDMALLRDLANIAERELSPSRSSLLDQLTGLSTQSSFVALARHILTLCERLDRPATLVFIRLDEQHMESPLHGHARGDRLLAEFADVLMSVFRESDLCGHLDAEEFGVLMTDCDKARVDKVLERLNTAVAEKDIEASRPKPRFYTSAVEYDPQRHDDIKIVLDEAAHRLQAELHPRRRRKPPTSPVY